MVGLGIILGLGVARGGSAIGAYLVLALAQVYLYSKVFDTGMVKALLIWLISQLIGVLLAAVVGLTLGVGVGIFSGGSDNESVSAAIDAACACPAGDQLCVDMRKAVVAAEVKKVVENQGQAATVALAAEMQRLGACLENAAPTPPDDSSRSAPASAAAKQTPPRPAAAKIRYTLVWQETSADQLVTMVGELLRFELRDGRQREGVLVSVQDGTANLRSAQSRGLDYHVDMASVKIVEVRKRVTK